LKRLVFDTSMIRRLGDPSRHQHRPGVRKLRFTNPSPPSPTPAILAPESSEVRFNVTRDARFQK
jgi:hypothetical protein